MGRKSKYTIEQKVKAVLDYKSGELVVKQIVCKPYSFSNHSSYAGS